MPAEPLSTLLPLDRFQSYLYLLARIELRRHVRQKVNASDVVQQTLLEAHEAQAGFKGRTPAEQAVWLRRILARNLADLERHLGRAKRDVDRERSLEAALEQSSVKLLDVLAADSPSPSEIAAREEEVVRLAEALVSLAEESQEAVLLRYCQGATLAEIGERLGVSRKVAARLLQEGLVALRSRLQPSE
jgi:RNA polymerase sigma-70 factor (ECF subfamily)